MPSADLAFVLLKSMMLLWIYTHGSGVGTWPGSQCCCKAEGAFGPTARPLLQWGMQWRRGGVRLRAKGRRPWGKKWPLWGEVTATGTARHGREQRGSEQVRTQKEQETRTFSPFPMLLHIPST